MTFVRIVFWVHYKVPHVVLHLCSVLVSRTYRDLWKQWLLILIWGKKVHMHALTVVCVWVFSFFWIEKKKEKDDSVHHHCTNHNLCWEMLAKAHLVISHRWLVLLVTCWTSQISWIVRTWWVSLTYSFVKFSWSY